MPRIVPVTPARKGNGDPLSQPQLLAVAAAYFARMDIEMRHLRALLALAEELNFTRAAERLHLTQQALSGQIRQLEERVGAQLVERDSRRVQLTRAGSTLCEHARPLLAGAEHAVLATRAAGNEAARLTVGLRRALHPAPGRARVRALLRRAARG